MFTSLALLQSWPNISATMTLKLEL